MTIISYLMIGVLWSLFLDILSKYQNLDRELKVTNLERIITSILWPFGMFIFLKEFIRSLLNNNNEL